MAKLLVVDVLESTKVPFLRGILTRSLTAAGLSFEKSYALASQLREQITGDSTEDQEITTVQLRERVAEQLAPHGTEIVQRYLGPSLGTTVFVRERDDSTVPYSRGKHRLSLMACGLTAEQATTAVGRMFDRLSAQERREITTAELQRMTYDHLVADLSHVAARRYLLWEQFVDSKRPLLLLIGGTAGCGKSTIATEVAHLLEIVRTQSTDMLREVMRMMVPERLLPVLHTSSFLAWQRLPSQGRVFDDPEAQMLEGYLTQVDLLSVASEAVLHRALTERVSMVLEGVHVHPSLLDRLTSDTDAIIVPVTLAVLKRKQLKARIQGRGRATPDRRAQRYLENFDSIWRLQSLLLAEADRTHVPMVVNDEKETAVREVIKTVLFELSRHFEGTPESVFG